MRENIRSIWPYFGLNVGNDINPGTGLNFNQSVIQNDADYLVNKVHVPFFRGNSRAFNTDSQTYVRFLMKTLHDLGGVVSYGIASDGAGLTAGNKAAFEAALATEALYATQQNFEYFQIGNEEEIRGSLGASAIYTYLQTLPSIVRAQGFAGKIVASVSQDNWSQWLANGLGNFTDLGLDVYGSGGVASTSISHFIDQCTSFQAAFGSNGYITEWAVNANATDLYQIDPYIYAQYMKDRLNYLKLHFTVPCVMHCWRFNGTNSLDWWAAKCDNGELRLFWFDVTEQRRLIYI